MTTHQDIISDGMTGTEDYVVCGFFTENYRPLAERLAGELAATNNPYHLFAREKGTATWRDIVRWKPEVILNAMDTYKQASIIQIDVDSYIRGSLAPMLNFTGDISARSKARLTRPMWPFEQKILIHVSSRAMVVKPTERAREFLAEWRDEMRSATYYQGGCEMALCLVVMRSAGLGFAPVDLRYAGLEEGRAPEGAVIVHRSQSAVTGK